MYALRSLGLRVAAVAVLALASLGARAALFLEGPSDWLQSEPNKDPSIIVFQVKADADTLVNTYSFETHYDAFAGILELSNDPKTTLPDVIAPPASLCNRFPVANTFGDSCVFFSVAPRTIPKDTVVTRWEFIVKQDAPVGPVSFSLNDFGAPFLFVVEADTGPFDSAEPIGFLDQNKQFRVMAPQVIPETSSWVLMLAGLVAVGARAYRRRIVA